VPRSTPPRSIRSRSILGRSLLALVGICAAVLLPVTAAVAAPAAPPALPPDGGIEAYAPYQGPSACDPVARTGVVRFRDLVLAAYPGTGDSGIVRGCTIGGPASTRRAGPGTGGSARATRPTSRRSTT
jgi:hypothetical protein